MEAMSTAGMETLFIAGVEGAMGVETSTLHCGGGGNMCCTKCNANPIEAGVAGFLLR